MKPLIDGDILLYEIGFASETYWREQGHEGLPPFDVAMDQFDNRIAFICATVEATEPPKLFFTGKDNFRFNVAKRQPYKDRKANKPWHYHNLKAYAKSKYEYEESVGMEADDLMAIEQTASGTSTIICSRDKDLRQVPGWHYGWEVHNQPSFGPELVTVDGYIELHISKDGKRKSLKGTGKMFFLAQLLMGDSVDTVRGLKEGVGPVTAFKILQECKTFPEGLKAVYGAYKKEYGLSAYNEMLEQGQLLWMVRERNKDGSPKLWGKI